MFVHASRAGGSSFTDLLVFWFGAPQPSWFFQATCLCTESNAAQTSSADTQGNPRASQFKATNGERNITRVHNPWHHQQAPEYLQTQVKAPSTTSFHSDTGQQTHGTFSALPLALRSPTNTEPPPVPGLDPELTNTHTGRVRELGMLDGDLLLHQSCSSTLGRVQQGPELQHRPHPSPTAPTRSVQIAGAASSEHGPCGCWQLPGGTSSPLEPHLARTGSETLGSSLQSRMGATSSARPSAGALLPRCSLLPLNPVSHAAAGCVQK